MESTNLAAKYLLSCALLLLVSGCHLGTPRVWTEETTRELSLAGDGLDTLAIKTDNGSIRTNGSPESDTITVKVTMKGGGADAADAQACLDAIRITEEREGARASLGWRFEGQRKSSWGTMVSFEVDLPSQLGLDAESHNGRITIRGTDGPIEGLSHNGPIVIADVGGAVKVESHNGVLDVESRHPELRAVTHNGEVRVKLTSQLPLAVHLETHNGGVQVTLPEDVSVKVQLETHNGSIKIDRDNETLSKSRHEVLATLGAGEGSLTATTHNGGVRIH